MSTTSQRPSKTAILRTGRRVAGAGRRANAPTPFIHSHPANKKSAEMMGRHPNAPRAA